MTAIYTVLAEGDDQQDPVADTARAILDGHIVLRRELAERGHYPAIDVAASISRCMPLVVSKPICRPRARSRSCRPAMPRCAS
jgi:flagellum-specific ATP synthase